MPRKKIVKEPIEKVKDEQVVLEIIEDSSDEEQGLPPPPEDNAIRVSKGNEVISQMTVEDIKQDLTPKAPKKKRVLSEEQKAKMKAGREKKQAEKKALQAGKKEKRPAPIITTNLSPPPVEEPPVPKEEQMPGWFKSYLNTQKKVEPEPVKEAPAKKPRSRGRPAGAKDSKPRAKPKKQSTVSPEPEEVVLPPPKTSMRFI